MRRLSIPVFLWFALSLIPAGAIACDAHFGFNPKEMGFFGGAAVRMAGLAPPKPVIELEHPSMAKSAVGETSEIVVNYKKPAFSKNVRMRLNGTPNVRLSQEFIELVDESGTVSFSYELLSPGYNSITLIVSGENEGKVVREVRQIYVRVDKSAPASDEPQVSSR